MNPNVLLAGMDQTRRALLRTTALTTTAGGLAGLAGCIGGGGGEATPTPTEASMDTETPTATTSPTGTETPAAATRITVNSHPFHGDILTDGEGLTLYLLTADNPNESVCTEDCAEAWPPLTVNSEDALEVSQDVTATLGTTERDDGSLQVTADETPLYYFVQDEAPGDAMGQEINNVWFVLRPDASAVKPTVSGREHEEFGPILTDADGMTLYLFTNDEDGTSNCTGDCAENWPPLTVGDRGVIESVMTDVEVGTINHPEAGTMATAAGHPLYYFAPDERPGDANGQGINGVWFVLDPEGNAVGM